MLVIMEHRDVQHTLEDFFYVETLGCFDVFQVDPAKCGGDGCHHLNDHIRVMRVDFYVKYVHISKALEQYTLAFHDRLGCPRPSIPQTEDGSPVGDYCYQVAFGGVLIGSLRVFFNLQYRHRHPGRSEEHTSEL